MFWVREIRDDDGVEYRILYLQRVYLEQVQGSVISTMNTKNLQGTPMGDNFFKNSSIERGGVTRQHSCQPLIMLGGRQNQNDSNPVPCNISQLLDWQISKLLPIQKLYLQTIERSTDGILSKVGSNWNQDHQATLKENLDQVKHLTQMLNYFNETHVFESKRRKQFSSGLTEIITFREKQSAPLVILQEIVD